MKRNVLILILCLILVGLFVTTINIGLVGADSGFDSSFDSDFGSDFGSSSFDFDSGGSGSGGPFAIFFPFLFIITMIIISVITTVVNKGKQKEIINNALNSKLTLLNPDDFIEDKRLEVEAFNIYKKIQYAWMNFDEELIRKNTTDEMYNMYLMQLDTLKVKSQKNVMYDIKYLGSKIKERYEENGQETIVINMNVSCYDFIIDTRTNNVVRGLANKVNYYNYELTFVKTVDDKKLDICPRCGAPVEENNSGVCEYCKSTLVSDKYTLILSKKKMISQR